MNSPNNMHKTEDKKDILRAPLIDGQKSIIYREIEDSGVADDVINIIEYTISSSDEVNKFNIIVEALSPLIQDKAKLIVSKLYLYKRRPCKFNNECKDKKCIFTHDKDKILKTPDNKRKTDSESTKRPKTESESTQNREVIVNRVDSSKFGEDDVLGYLSTFGEIESIKKLNDIKWLITFKEISEAKNFVSSRDPILGDNSIKKYFNSMENMKKYELNSLFDKQEEILKQITSNDIPELEELKRIILRIKTLVKETEQNGGTQEPRGSTVRNTQI